MDLLTVEDLSCPVCGEIFKNPALLSCSHSVCKECLQQFWKTKKQECPYCGRKSLKNDPPDNLALQNLCEMFLKERKKSRSPESEEICNSHSKKHKLFCLEDKQPACAECFTPQNDVNPTVIPVSEVPLYKEQLNAALKCLHEKLVQCENILGEFEKTLQHIRSQAQHTEHQIKQQFEKLHQFLRDEEEATVAALREEEKQKKQIMKEKLDEMNRHVLALSHAIKHTETMKASDVCFKKEFPVSMERVLRSQPDLQMCYGALIHVPQYLGNLPYRVWKKMQDIIQHTPVILDPNTSNPCLVLSDDLTRVASCNCQPVPDNPERFDCHRCVVGSEGFNSGTHYWDVEIKDSSVWTIGVTVASNPRKGWGVFNTDVWSLQYNMPSQSGCPVVQQLSRVRVILDYDAGTVSFFDLLTNTYLYTFKTTFTQTLFPFFCSSDSLRILPVNIQ